LRKSLFLHFPGKNFANDGFDGWLDDI